MRPRDTRSERGRSLPRGLRAGRWQAPTGLERVGVVPYPPERQVLGAGG